MICVKCGFEQSNDSLNICAKCGAVQEKVKQVLKGQLDNLVIACDELITINNKTIESAEILKGELSEDTGNIDYGILIETKQNLEKVFSASEKLGKNLENLTAYTKAIKTEFQEKGKVSKAIEYYEAYKSKADQLNAEIKGIRDVFKEGGAEKDVAPQKDDFSFKSNPKERNLYIEQINDIETKLTREKFPALDTMSFVYRLLGWAFALLTFVVIAFVVFSGLLPFLQKVVGTALVAIVGAIVVVSIIAIAESIKLGVEIEKNSRATMEYMKVLVEKTIADK